MILQVIVRSWSFATADTHRVLGIAAGEVLDQGHEGRAAGRDLIAGWKAQAGSLKLSICKFMLDNDLESPETIQAAYSAPCDTAPHPTRSLQ